MHHGSGAYARTACSIGMRRLGPRCVQVHAPWRTRMPAALAGASNPPAERATWLTADFLSGMGALLRMSSHSLLTSSCSSCGSCIYMSSTRSFSSGAAHGRTVSSWR